VVLGLDGALEQDGVDEDIVGLLRVRLALLLDRRDRRARRVIDLPAEGGEDALEVLALVRRLSRCSRKSALTESSWAESIEAWRMSTTVSSMFRAEPSLK